MRTQFIFIAIFIGTLYSQCDSYTSSECDSNSDCEWVEDIELGNCYDLGSSSACYANGCDGWEDNGGNNYNNYLMPYCYGGTYVIEDNSYCEEVAVLECLELDQLQCNSDGGCNWVDDYQWANCSDFDWEQLLCDENPNCWGDFNSNYNGTVNAWYCAGGDYQMDTSYCGVNEFLQCSEMNELECSGDDSCDWVEEIDSISCYSLSEMHCGQVQGCNWGCSDWGDWYTWICYEYTCQGGTGQMDNSSCEEIEYISGDINGDLLINILDVIEIVNLILESEYSQVTDMNYDGNVNVLDVVLVVDIILGN